MMENKEAIEYLLYMKHDVQAGSPMDIALDTAIEALKQPTIEPEVRHGRWVEKVDNFHSNIPMRYSECSVCGRTENPCWAESWKYCPYCGAKMDGGVDNG